MQSAHNIGHRFELRFMSPSATYAYVDSLKDIDIADAFFITDFESMDVLRPKLEKWTTRKAKRFIDEIKQDVLFDFPLAVFIVDPDPAGKVVLEICIEVEEPARDLKMLQCMPRAFFQRFKGERKNL